MKTTIDAAGRIVIPADIRRAAGLVAGSEIEVRVRGGVVELEPAATPIRLVKRGKLKVAAAEATQETLSEETVRETMDSLRLGS
jgi:AbrB family looped-hinge helix DNA binding protein